MSIVSFVLLGAYFGLMFVLSLFGLHRYALVYLYYRHRDKAQGPPLRRFAQLPPVTVQLPTFNERFVVEQLIDAACGLRYPRHLLQIQVLDDSTDETAALLERLVGEKRAAGEPIQHIRRDTREGYKAGALAEGLRRASGELIAIFDADFAPPPSFLEELVHYFADPRVGMVQARWTYRNRDRSLLTRVQAMLLDGHFVFEHGGRARSGRFFNFNGTAGILRKSMIKDAGGWQQDTLTEDTDLSYRAQLRGWKFVYAPHVRAPSELPADMTGFQVQQFRWAKGLLQTGLKLLPGLLRSRWPMSVKLEGAFHLLANIAHPMLLLLAVLIPPSILVRQGFLQGRLLWLDLPAFLLTFCSLSSFYTLSQAELGRGGPQHHLRLVPALAMAGVSLAISNSRAVAEALCGSRSAFERTAKFSADRGVAAQARSAYGRRGGWRAAVNLAAAAYFAGGLGIAVHLEHWLGIPVIALFLGGFLYAGISMLADTRASGPFRGRATNWPRGARQRAGGRETCRRQ